jgi:eukaryotic-like serine/threonine-protein kinase
VPLKQRRLYSFGDFSLDTATRTLTRGDLPIPLFPKCFDVLLYLVENPGRVITKDELLRGVWTDAFVEESNLSQNVSLLRKALDDRGNAPRYIVTVPRKGYQFAATPATQVFQATAVEEDFRLHALPDRVLAAVEEINADHQEPTAPHPIDNRLSGGRFVNKWKIATVGTLALAAAGGWLAYEHFRGAHATSAVAAAVAHRRSIAVLGFRNLSGRPEEAWLSTALAEMLSTELVAGEKLRLVSGEDIARTKLELPLADADSLSRDTLTRLHRNLDSDLIVLGSYTTLGEKPDTRIRLDLRLQDTAAGETVADVAVTGGEADLFNLVSQAGSRLREKLGVEEVSPVEAVSVRASLPANREAARLYSEGLARLRVFNALEARALLEQSVAADSKFALSHSALAEAWSRLGYDQKAQSEARQAYDLSANLAREEKLLVEGRYRDIAHQHEKAIDVYRTIFAMFPDNVDYGLKLADVQVSDGKGHDALATVEALRKLAPPASEDPRIDLEEAAAWGSLSEYKHEQPLERAADKAKAEGSRLILAKARQGQCWAFAHLEQIDRAITACRQAGEIFAEAGDREGEATSLRTWADAISRTDAPESIRLYQQALDIFRKNGSERGVAIVFNNLGLIYEAQGDPATAEKMHRQALAGFRLLENRNSQSKALGNIAGERLDQGDLPHALQLYEESMELDREDTGRIANAGYNIAIVHQLQGDLPGAKRGFEQSLAIWQKNGDRISSAYALWSLGTLLVLEADFKSARKMLEQALAIQSAAGEKIPISDTQLELADLSLEEMRSPVEQEAAVRQILDVFQKENARDDEISAWCVLSRALLAQGKAAAAKETVQHAQALAEKSQNPEIRWGAAVVAARIAGVVARKELTDTIAQSHRLGYALVELDARLALAEIEMKSGQTAQGRAHLIGIEADAKAKGYNRVARNAAIALVEPRPSGRGSP